MVNAINQRRLVKRKEGKTYRRIEMNRFLNLEKSKGNKTKLALNLPNVCKATKKGVEIQLYCLGRSIRFFPYKLKTVHYDSSSLTRPVVLLLPERCLICIWSVGAGFSIRLKSL